MKIILTVLGGICLVAIIAAILYPVFAKARRHSDPRYTVGHLSNLYAALTKYADAHDGKLPPMQNEDVAQKALIPYVQSSEWGKYQPGYNFYDPATNQPFLPNPILSGKKLASFNKEKDWLVAYYGARPEPAGGEMVLTLAGHVKYILPKQWPTVKKASKIP